MGEHCFEVHLEGKVKLLGGELLVNSRLVSS